MATLREEDCPNILLTTTGFPKKQSLRHIISKRFANGMPEDSIAIIMREILQALDFLHVSVGTGPTVVDSSNICVNTDKAVTTIKLALDPGKQLVHPGTAWNQGRTPTAGIWGLGITALEMGYGSLPGNGKAHLASLANNMMRILKLKLDYPDEKGKEEAKNKGKEKLGSADDPKLKEETIEKGKEELVIDDDQKVKEKAMQKGKEKLKLGDYLKGEEMAKQKGKEKLDLADYLKGEEMAKQEGKEKLKLGDYLKGEEMAKQKGKEKLELADYLKGEEMAKEKGNEKLEIADDQKGQEMANKKGEEVKKLKIKLPALEKLLDVHYVEHLDEELMQEEEDQAEEKEAKVGLIQKFKKAIEFFRKNKNDNADEGKFSRDFLEVVLLCLDEQNLTTAKQILEQPFFQKTIDMKKFGRRIRKGFSPLKMIPFLN